MSPAHRRSWAIENCLIIERKRIGGDHRLDTWYLPAERVPDRVLDCTHAIERQCATDCHHQINESLLANRARAHLFDADHARHTRGNSSYFFCRTGRRDIDERIDGTLAKSPAGDANHHRHYQRRHRIRPRQTVMHADKTNQHGQRRP